MPTLSRVPHAFMNPLLPQKLRTELKASWKNEMARDLKAFHGIDVESEVVKEVSQAIADQIDKQILRELGVDPDAMEKGSTQEALIETVRHNLILSKREMILNPHDYPIVMAAKNEAAFTLERAKHHIDRMRQSPHDLHRLREYQGLDNIPDGTL